jgi:hypothetical protein
MDPSERLMVLTCPALTAPATDAFPVVVNAGQYDEQAPLQVDFDALSEANMYSALPFPSVRNVPLGPVRVCSRTAEPAAELEAAAAAEVLAPAAVPLLPLEQPASTNATAIVAPAVSPAIPTILRRLLSCVFTPFISFRARPFGGGSCVSP